jgi:hypothetical protein
MGKKSQDRLTVQQFKSRVTSSRWRDPRGRMQTSHSPLERDSALLLEFQRRILELDSQVFLKSNEEVVRIAKRLGVKSPSFNVQFPHMSTDLLAVMLGPEGEFLLACSVKSVVDVLKSRVVELHSIERCFWEARDAKFEILTEACLPGFTSENLRRARHCSVAAAGVVPRECRREIAASLLERAEAAPWKRIIDITRHVDGCRGAAPGAAMTCLWASIWHRDIEIDLEYLLSPATHAQALRRPAAA